jgi:L-iditol 2-dehydrogenase
MYVLPGTFMFRVPSSLKDEVAVLAEQMAVAYGAFGRAFQSPNAKEGYSPADTVVIQGVGPLGICNVFMARMLGASKIIVIDKSEYRLNLTHQLCNTQSIDIKDFPKTADRVGRIMELTENLGADLVVECTGAPDILSEGLEMMRLGGTYLVEGAFVEEEPTKISASRIVSKNARIIGAAGMPYQAYGRVLEMMAAFKDLIPFEKAVTHQFGIGAAEEALKKSMSPDSMKVVVTSKLN